MVRLLKAAGFEDLEMEAIAVNSESYGLEAFLHQFDPGRLTPLIQAGVLSQEETDQLITQRTEFLASDPLRPLEEERIEEHRATGCACAEP